MRCNQHGVALEPGGECVLCLDHEREQRRARRVARVVTAPALTRVVERSRAAAPALSQPSSDRAENKPNLPLSAAVLVASIISSVPAPRCAQRARRCLRANVVSVSERDIDAHERAAAELTRGRAPTAQRSSATHCRLRSASRRAVVTAARATRHIVSHAVFAAQNAVK